MNIYCSKCGAKSMQNAAFCASCGTSLRVTAITSDSIAPRVTDMAVRSHTNSIRAAPRADGQGLIFEGITLPVTIDHGEVLATDKQYVTETYSSSSLPDSHGNRRIAIDSDTTEHQEIWYKNSDGIECSIKLEDRTAPVRAGNEISTIRLGNSKPLMVIVNHTTGKYHWVHGKEFAFALHAFEIRFWRQLFIGIGLSLGALLTIAPIFQSGLSLCVGPGYVCYRGVKGYRRCKRFDAAVINHIESLAESMLSQK